MNLLNGEELRFDRQRFLIMNLKRLKAPLRTCILQKDFRGLLESDHSPPLPFLKPLRAKGFWLGRKPL